MALGRVLGATLSKAAKSEPMRLAGAELAASLGTPIVSRLGDMVADRLETGLENKGIGKRVVDFYKGIGDLAANEAIPHLAQEASATNIDEFKSRNMSAAGYERAKKGLAPNERDWRAESRQNPFAGREDDHVVPSTLAANLGIRDPIGAARGIGLAATGAAVIGTGLGIKSLLAGGKPASAYSAPVDPNPNVTAANVSYQNQAALEEQKFRHHMALQAAREQSRIPGPQNTSVGSYGGGPYSSGDLMGMAQGIANQKYKFG
jgi:hypothetical protein